MAVKSGYADLYVNNFDEINASDGNNMGDRLPKSKRDSMWVLENISPITSVPNQIMVIMN